jgi:hypothetical protein
VPPHLAESALLAALRAAQSALSTISPRSSRRTRRQQGTLHAVDLTARLRRARLVGENENKNARGSFGALVFILPGQPGSQIDGKAAFNAAYVPYVSYVVILPCYA